MFGVDFRRRTQQRKMHRLSRKYWLWDVWRRKLSVRLQEIIEHNVIKRIMLNSFHCIYAFSWGCG